MISFHSLQLSPQALYEEESNFNVKSSSEYSSWGTYLYVFNPRLFP